MPAGVSAYVPLANVTLSSSAASVTFSSISQAYRDLVMVVSPKSDAAGKNVYLRFNGDTGATYFWVNMRGDGSTTISQATDSPFLEIAADAQIDGINPSTYITQIQDYVATDKHKPILSRGNGTGYGVNAVAGRWAGTSAMTSIAVLISSGNFTAGSTFSLYGIAS